LTEIVPESGATFNAQADVIPAHLGLDASTDGMADHDLFASICNPGKSALLVSWRTLEEVRHRLVRVVRDYGMFDRREAPQYYPEPEQA